MPSTLPISVIKIILWGLGILLLAGCTAAEPEPPPATTTPSPIPPTETPDPSPTFPPPTPTPAAGDTRLDDFGVEQVWVPPGSFLMGTVESGDLDPPSWAANELKSEQPQHQVTLTQGYWIDKFEVTNAAFAAFVEAGGYLDRALWSEAGWGWLEKQNINRLPFNCRSSDGPDHPRVCITWYESEAYAHWRGGRLPTEAEWEFAARGPDSSIYPWGDAWDPAKANVVDSAGLVPVGTYPDGVSWVGAYEMSGNAMEWVQDWLDSRYYEQGDMVDPQGPETGARKVEKGGWWGSHPFIARAAYRHFEDPPTYQDHHIGVRVVSPQ